MPRYRTLISKRRFCRIRRPYQTHKQVDLSPFLQLLDDSRSFQSASQISNISKQSLHRFYQQWTAAGRPKPFVLQEKRGLKKKMSDAQEQLLVNFLNQKIDNCAIVTHQTVQKLALSIYNQDLLHNLRR